MALLVELDAAIPEHDGETWERRRKYCAFATPAGIVTDPAGNVYVADSWNHRVRRIDPSGTISTIAGTSVATYSGDGGPPKSAQLDTPRSLAVDKAGSLYIGDTQTQRIRKVTQPAAVR